jgi:SAM-dependent methyltransferase
MSRLESDYYEHRGFDPEHSRRVRSFYVSFFAEASPVLEIACGRGEFLSLLGESGISCQGVDRDAGMTAIARQSGHDVVLADALDFVADEAQSNRFGGVFCAHVVEHLQPEEAARLFEGIKQTLRPGGTFVVVAPNPACYAVLTHDFWSDPTHIRFYDVPLLAFLCGNAGLVVEEEGTNPHDHPGPPPGFEADLALPDWAISAAAQEAIEQLRPEAREVGVLLKELLRNLARTNDALRDLEGAHRSLVRGMYQPNEIYVVAKRPLEDPTGL